MNSREILPEEQRLSNSDIENIVKYPNIADYSNHIVLDYYEALEAAESEADRLREGIKKAIEAADATNYTFEHSYDEMRRILLALLIPATNDKPHTT